MEVYLIRHTTPDVEQGICYGQSDLALASSFEEEARGLLEALPTAINKVFTSPLKRCLQLAKKISCQTIKEVPQLQEMNFGDWELKPWNAIPKAELNPWMEDFVHQQVPNGESMQQLAERVLNWYEELKSQELEKIAVVSHAGPIRIILSEINQTPLKEAFERYKVGYGNVIPISLT